MDFLSIYLINKNLFHVIGTWHDLIGYKGWHGLQRLRSVSSCVLAGNKVMPASAGEASPTLCLLPTLDKIVSC
jgi:hypothetical protein